MIVLNEILTIPSIDLASFESRGAKSGINNARTTGPVFVGGTYSPPQNVQTGSGTFTRDSSVLTGISFSYGLKANDSLAVDGSSFVVTKVNAPTIVELDKTSIFTGSSSFSATMTQREYLIEPDVYNNTITVGTAAFYNGSKDVYGTGTFWDSTYSLGHGDFIKHDGYQVNYAIDSVVSDTQLVLKSAYSGDTTTGPYTANKVIIGREWIQYAKDNFTYDKNGGRWKYDQTTDSRIATSLNFAPLADGIELKFSKASTSAAPDISQTALVLNKILAQSTQYETPQFALPAVPFPEDTMVLYLNNVKKDRYSSGNQDYIISYSQYPTYTPPPPPASRFVANLMFLKRALNIAPSIVATQKGILQFVDATGNSLGDVLQGSERIWVNMISQVPYRDYVVEPNSGLAVITDSTIGEPIVRYIAKDYSDFIDYGFSVNMNGIPQQISFPAKNTDDVLFQPTTGRFKPARKAYPGPGETYEIHYQVEGVTVENEAYRPSDGQTVVLTKVNPIMRDSLIVTKNGEVLDEDTDYHVSYQTGSVNFYVALLQTDQILFTYTPLSLQVNGMSRSDSTSYCTTYDSHIIIQDPATFTFSIQNTNLKTDNLTVLRIYNETRDADYDLTNLTKGLNSIVLWANATNNAIGCASTDTIIIDYKFPGTTTEFKPVYINRFVVSADSSSVYFDNQDIRSLFPVDGVMRLADPQSSAEYLFIIDSSSYSGTYTQVNFKTKCPADLVNPAVGVAEPITFLSVPATANPVVVDTQEIVFSTDISNIFKRNTLLRIADDVYKVVSSDYNREQNATTVGLSIGVTADYTSNLSSFFYSNSPMYTEGDTELFPLSNLVTTSDQPGLILSTGNEDRIFTLSVSSTAIQIDSNSYSYAAYPTLGSIASAITTADMTAQTYIPAWNSNKLMPVSKQIYKDLSQVLNVNPALRLNNVDTTNFTVSDGGTIILDLGLVKGQNYDLDYMGQQYLGNQQVVFSVTYFTNLPAKSKVMASFQFTNLDQFYVQVMSQRDFLGDVTIPRIEQETASLSDNVGQGGTVSGDEDQGNSEGGLTNDEYRRKDAEIETRIFKNIYDFFQYRLSAYGQEMYAATGLKLFDNDGTYSSIEQAASTKSLNRIFPSSDYTNSEPYRANPLTGEFTGTGAHFTNGSPTVTCTSSLWLTQLRVDSTCYIGRTDSTKRYRVSSVTTDNSLQLATQYTEGSTTDPDGDLYKASTGYPVYDDDGYMGPKIKGTRAKNFGLIASDVFDISLNGIPGSYTFPAQTPPWSYFFPLSKLDGPTVASNLSSIPSLNATYERILDPNTTYGYKDVLVLRTDPYINSMVLGSGAAVLKLGFTPGAISFGNWNRSDSHCEASLCLEERGYLTTEQTYVGNLYAAGTINKLDRTSAFFTPFIQTYVGNEINDANQEQIRISSQMSAQNFLLDETSISPFSNYTDTSAALLRATTTLADNSSVLIYDASVYPNWGIDGTNWKWSINFRDRIQYAPYVDSSGNATDIMGPGVVSINGDSTFYIQIPQPAYYSDLRFLNATIAGASYTPALYDYYLSSVVPGTWSTWLSQGYSVTNRLKFTFTDTSPLMAVKRINFSATATSYSVDKLGLNLYWTLASVPYSATFRYSDYPKVYMMKSVISSLTSGVFDSTGNSIYNLRNSQAFLLASGPITVDATMYPGLSPCYARFQTIEDTNIRDRLLFINSRRNDLNARISYLNTRERQIGQSLSREETLRDSTGDTGDLYTWADARFNRRQGCNAKLDQITKMTQSNQSALSVNKKILG